MISILYGNWPQWAIVVGICLALPTPSGAVDDVSPRLNTKLGRLDTYGYDDAGDSSTNPVFLTANELRVFPYFFGDFTDAIGDPYFDNDPGIHALASNNTVGYVPSGLPTGSVIAFDIPGDLQYWSGSGAVAFQSVPAGETLRLSLGSGATTIGTGTNFYPGFDVSSIDAAGGMHKHLNAELQAGTNALPADGVYLFAMRLKLLQADGQSPYPNVAPSLPYFVLFDNNASLSAFQSAQQWVQTNLVPFGDYDRDGVTTVADLQAMMTALTDLNKYKADHQLTDFDLTAFGDVNQDGVVNNADLQALLHYLANGGTGDTGLGSGSLSTVPEPASLVLFIAGTMLLTAGAHYRGRETCRQKGDQALA
jgi:hypothetical protein